MLSFVIYSGFDASIIKPGLRSLQPAFSVKRRDVGAADFGVRHCKRDQSDGDVISTGFGIATERMYSSLSRRIRDICVWVGE